VLRVNVFHNPLGDCTNSGMSGGVDSLILVNEEFDNVPHYPKPHEPRARLVRNQLGSCIIVPENNPDGHYQMGGNFAYSCDSRFSDATKIYGAIPIHDRSE